MEISYSPKIGGRVSKYRVSRIQWASLLVALLSTQAMADYPTVHTSHVADEKEAISNFVTELETEMTDLSVLMHAALEDERETLNAEFARVRGEVEDALDRAAEAQAEAEAARDWALNAQGATETAQRGAAAAAATAGTYAKQAQTAAQAAIKNFASELVLMRNAKSSALSSQAGAENSAAAAQGAERTARNERADAQLARNRSLAAKSSAETDLALAQSAERTANALADAATAARNAAQVAATQAEKVAGAAHAERLTAASQAQQAANNAHAVRNQVNSAITTFNYVRSLIDAVATRNSSFNGRLAAAERNIPNSCFRCTPRTEIAKRKRIDAGAQYTVRADVIKINGGPIVGYGSTTRTSARARSWERCGGYEWVGDMIYMLCNDEGNGTLAVIVIPRDSNSGGNCGGEA